MNSYLTDNGYIILFLACWRKMFLHVLLEFINVNSKLEYILKKIKSMNTITIQILSLLYMMHKPTVYQMYKIY